MGEEEHSLPQPLEAWSIANLISGLMGCIWPYIYLHMGGGDNIGIWGGGEELSC